MPFRITIEPDFLRIEISGTFSRADLVSFQAEIEAIEHESVRIPHRLFNGASLVDRDVGVNDVLSLAARRKAQTFKNSFKSALVAATPAGLGMARMFQTLNDHPQIRIEIFDSEQAAEHWLREEPGA